MKIDEVQAMSITKLTINRFLAICKWWKYSLCSSPRDAFSRNDAAASDSPAKDVGTVTFKRASISFNLIAKIVFIVSEFPLSFYASAKSNKSAATMKIAARIINEIPLVSN